MQYITAEYYNNEFHGTAIDANELTRLIDAASVAIDMAVVSPITTVTDNVKKATAYEVECLYQQGGIDAVTGFAATGGGKSERLGDYSVSAGSGAAEGGQGITYINGVPLSPLALALLRKDGLLNRWAYQWRHRRA